MTWLSDPQGWIALATLTALEIVLGVDNIIFISILAGKLPAEQRGRARLIGLSLALSLRVFLLFGISWVIGWVEPLFALFGKSFSGRDLILIGGGLFLLAKATIEIHHRLEGEEAQANGRPAPSFAMVIAQIAVLDAVFSLDSVITAVGMADDVSLMIAAVVIAMGVMLASAGPLSKFVDRHPTVKMLALSFLLLIGMVLVAEGFGQHIAKGYVYFALGFSVFVELLNLKLRKPAAAPVELRKPAAARPSA